MSEEVLLSEFPLSVGVEGAPTVILESEPPFLGVESAGSPQNVLVLSLLLALALITNLSAFPVILFRRTK